jgi:hypothetical protein
MLLTDLPNDQPRTPGESVIVPPMLRNPKDTRTEAAAVTFPPPRTPDFWKNREFTFYQQTFTETNTSNNEHYAEQGRRKFLRIDREGHMSSVRPAWRGNAASLCESC